MASRLVRATFAALGALLCGVNASSARAQSDVPLSGPSGGGKSGTSPPPAGGLPTEPPDTLRDEGFGEDGDAVSENETRDVQTALHYGFAAGFARADAFAAPPFGNSLRESLWALRFNLGIPLGTLDPGELFAISIDTDIALVYPTSLRGSAGQSAYRFHFDPALHFFTEFLLADSITTLVTFGLGYGIERIQYSRSTLFGYGPLLDLAWTAYADRVSFAGRYSPFVRVPLRYKPPLSKFSSSDSRTDDELRATDGDTRFAFARNGNFTSATAGLDVGVSGARDRDGTRTLLFVGTTYHWQRYKSLRRDVSTSPIATRSPSLSEKTVRLGIERTY